MSGCTIPQLLHHTMPTLQRLHAGDTITANLTEYQWLLTNKRAGQALWHQLPSDAVIEMIRICFRLACWMHYGMPVFRLTPDLFAALLLTDPTNVEPHLVRQPFPTFALTIPPNFWASEDPDGTKHDVHLAWVHTYTTLKSATPLTEYNSLAAVLQRPHYVMTYLEALAGPVRLHENLLALPTEKTPDASLSPWLDSPEKEAPGFMRIERTQDDLPIQAALRRLYVNLCLYVLEHGCGTREKTSLLTRLKKRTRKGRQKPSLTAAQWLLGQHVKIHPELVLAAQNWVDAQRGIRTGWKVRKRYVVRGHWRNQAYGPKHSLRRDQFIEPHWKGPADGTKLQHIYVDNKTKGEEHDHK